MGQVAASLKLKTLNDNPYNIVNELDGSTEKDRYTLVP